MRSFTFLLLLALSAGCSSTARISSAWQKPDGAPFAPKRVLVFGIAPAADSLLREKMEVHFVGDLSDAGFRASGATARYGAGYFAGRDREEVYRQLRADSFEAVVTIRLIGKEQKVLELPDRVQRYQQRPFWDPRTEPGGALPETQTYTELQWESNAYNLPARELVYTVRTEAFASASSDALAHEYGKLISRHLLASGVFTK